MDLNTLRRSKNTGLGVMTQACRGVWHATPSPYMGICLVKEVRRIPSAWKYAHAPFLAGSMPRAWAWDLAQDHACCLLGGGLEPQHKSLCFLNDCFLVFYYFLKVFYIHL
jgi:hypothetical protein